MCGCLFVSVFLSLGFPFLLSSFLVRTSIFSFLSSLFSLSFSKCGKNHCTPRKINMEPKNHPLEKENHLPNLHFLCSMLILFNFPGLAGKREEKPMENRFTFKSTTLVQSPTWRKVVRFLRRISSFTWNIRVCYKIERYKSDIHNPNMCCFLNSPTSNHQQLSAIETCINRQILMSTTKGCSKQLLRIPGGESRRN